MLVLKYGEHFYSMNFALEFGLCLEFGLNPVENTLHVLIRFSLVSENVMFPCPRLLLRRAKLKLISLVRHSFTGSFGPAYTHKPFFKLVIQSR